MTITHDSRAAMQVKLIDYASGAAWRRLGDPFGVQSPTTLVWINEISEIDWPGVRGSVVDGGLMPHRPPPYCS